jgi:7,8-dihydroneopterin aldolase/epimerase/oxygenase
MTTTLTIENIECFSYHGCMKEETSIGGRFSVDVTIESDFTSAVKNDELSDAADYVIIHEIVHREMAIPSHLIEHVAGRILQGLNRHFSKASNIIVTVKKYNPPVNGYIGAASFRLALQ